MLEKATKDYLTGFFLRQDLKPFLEKVLLDAKQKRRGLSVALIDIDRFKKYNDKFGHSFGDLILKYVSSTLRLSLQQEEQCTFRYGGDEFVVVFPNKGLEETTEQIQKCNRNFASRPFLCENKLFKISLSGGVASFPRDGNEPWKLLEKADEAMYFSKRHGRAHITQARRMPYIKFRNNIISVACLYAVFYSLFTLYSYFPKPNIESIRKKIIEEKITDIKIPGVKIIPPAEPEKTNLLDVIILKDKSVFEGYVLKETKDKIIFSLYLEHGEASTVFNKSEIAEIKRKFKPLPSSLQKNQNIKPKTSKSK